MGTTGNKITVSAVSIRAAYAALLSQDCTIRGALKDALQLQSGEKRDVEVHYWKTQELQVRDALTELGALV